MLANYTSWPSDKYKEIFTQNYEKRNKLSEIWLISVPNILQKVFMSFSVRYHNVKVVLYRPEIVFMYIYIRIYIYIYVLNFPESIVIAFCET